MTSLRKMKSTLRIGAIIVFLGITALWAMPIAVMAADGGPKPVVTSPVVLTPAAPTPAPAPAPAPAAAPATAPVPDAVVTTPVVAVPDPDAKEVAAPAPVEEKTQQWWQALLMPVLGVFGLFISAFLAGGLLKLVKLIERKFDIDIPDSIEKMMAEKARWAVAWVEEKAEDRLLNGDGVKTPGAEKTAEVVNLLETFAEGLGYGNDWQKEKIEALAKGVLHLERDKAVGSVGDRAAKLTEKKNGNG